MKKKESKKRNSRKRKDTSFSKKQKTQRNSKKTTKNEPTKNRYTKKESIKKNIQKKRRKRLRKVKRRRKMIQKILLDAGVTFLVFGLLLIPVFQFLIAVPKATGYAMSPYLKDGSRTIVYRHNEINRFDLIYFEVPNRGNGLMNFRRVIGLPGERIEYRGETLFVDGQEKAERFIGVQLIEALENKYTLTEDFNIEDIIGSEKGRIPDDYYLVLGDNRSFSVDSRSYGLVPAENIIGTVEFIF